QHRINKWWVLPLKCKICGCDSDEEHLDDTIDFDNTYKNIMKEEEGKHTGVNVVMLASTLLYFGRFILNVVYRFIAESG
ncbi:MAG TPA: hypothetical protein VI033_05765, partial [Candidatus Nitrosopolaris sp.]